MRLKLTTKDSIRTAMKLYCIAIGGAILAGLTKVFLEAYSLTPRTIRVSIDSIGEADIELVLITTFWVFMAVLVLDYCGLLKHKSKIQ